MKIYNECAIKSDNNSGVDENNVGNNYILLTEQIILKKKKLWKFDVSSIARK